MNALMMVIALWLSANFGLPMTDNLPRVEFVPAARLVALRSEALLSATGKTPLPEATAGLEDVVAAYDDVSKIILLRDDWKGRTPAEISVLVHEMVHHGQDLAGGTYGCKNEREKLAYEAQERWLGLFGRDLASEFQIDPFTRLIKTLCAY